MADILIHGISIPRNCFECPLFTNCDACEGHECGCGLLGGIGYEEDISEDRRRDDCPLIELPEHGDLIDASKISLQEYEQAAHNALHNGKGSILYDCGVLAGARAITQFVRRQPVIVPASKSKEETE